jgi:hypothetical protein
MTELYVIPTIGRFKVSSTPTYDFYDKSKILYTVLNIGGKQDKCVNITIHPEQSPNSKEMILSWAEVINKACTTDAQIIKGDATVEMVQLALTIAKEYAPYAEYVSLSDMSYFICNTPDGKKKISLPPYHIAFHDKTWYEDKFGAVMINEADYKKYRAYIQNMYKEGQMPASFDFGNNRLREILYPLYAESKTWKEFFTNIEKQYPQTKCALMHPWIENAMDIICEGNKIHIGQKWKIYLNQIPRIHYYQTTNPDMIGGSAMENMYEPQYYDYRDVNYNDTMKWDIDAFLLKNKSHNTKKLSRKIKRINRTKRKTRT